MSLKLKRRETVAGGLRRIISERLHAALDVLPRIANGGDEAVHESRKRLKESRAVLRLLRAALPEELYQTEKNVYRDVARPMSAARDARVLLDALDKLAQSDSPRVEIGSLWHEIESRRTQCHDELSTGGTLERLKLVLTQALSRIGAWPVSDAEWESIRAGIAKAYRGGRRKMRAITSAEQDDPERSNESLHEWRKQAKALWYQIEVLENAWCAPMKTLGHELHELTDALGEDHDLAVLHDLVGANGAAGLEPPVREALLFRIEQQRQRLQEQALGLGRRIYAERTRHFLHRVRTYWNAWRETTETDSAV